MKKTLLAATTLLASLAAVADEAPEDFREKLTALIGDRMPISAIAETELPGVYEVTAGNRVLYASVKGDLVMVGNLFDVSRGVNVGEEKQNEITRGLAEEEIGAMSTEQMVVFSNGSAKRHITVFTDVECGYCRKLHQEVPALNAAGIEVRYMLYPVISERSYPNAVSVWCAEDQQTALTQAKRGQAIEPLSCDNPVDAHMEIGRKLGVRGTPFLVLDDFSVIPGYVPASDLIAQLGLE